MHAPSRSAPWWSLAIAACLTACQASSLPSTKPTPPRVSGCLAEPARDYPAEPARPTAGQPITDAYVAAVIGWANESLGIATADRIAWRGERRCIVKLVEAGQVR